MPSAEGPDVQGKGNSGKLGHGDEVCITELWGERPGTQALSKQPLIAELKGN